MLSSFVNIPLMTLSCLLFALQTLVVLESFNAQLNPPVVECMETRNGYLC